MKWILYAVYDKYPQDEHAPINTALPRAHMPIRNTPAHALPQQSSRHDNKREKVSSLVPSRSQKLACSGKSYHCACNRASVTCREFSDSTAKTPAKHLIRSILSIRLDCRGSHRKRREGALARWCGTPILRYLAGGLNITAWLGAGFRERSLGGVLVGSLGWG